MKVKPISPVEFDSVSKQGVNALHSIRSVDTESAAEVRSGFERPWWLFSAHLEALYMVRACAGIKVEYEQSEVRTPDSDRILLHYIPGERSKPLLIVFHGLEGTSDSPSVRLLAHHFSSRGWSVAVPHFRTCGMMNRLPRAYHAGDKDEIEWMVRYAANLANAPQTYAVGVSFGGNALAKWLGSGGQLYLSAAAAVCAPFDLAMCCLRLDRLLNRRIYGRHFLETLLEKLQYKMRKYPFLMQGRTVGRIRTIREFDEAFTAPIHGFQNAADYYSKASAKRDLRTVGTRLLCINPLNDPLVPPQTVPKQKDVAQCVSIERPRTGGHLGFVSGRKRVDWLPNRLEAFFRDQ